MTDLYSREHFHDPTRPYMSMSERAAQFMPFQALRRGRDFLPDDDGDDEIDEGR